MIVLASLLQLAAFFLLWLLRTASCAILARFRRVFAAMLPQLPAVALRAINASWAASNAAMGALRQLSAAPLTPEQRRAMLQRLAAIEAASLHPPGSTDGATLTAPMPQRRSAQAIAARALLRRVESQASLMHVDEAMQSLLSVSPTKDGASGRSAGSKLAPAVNVGLSAPAARAAIAGILRSDSRPQMAQAFLELAFQSGAVPPTAAGPAIERLARAYAAAGDAAGLVGCLLRLHKQSGAWPGPTALRHVFAALAARPDSRLLQHAWRSLAEPALAQWLSPAAPAQSGGVARQPRQLSAAFVSQLAYVCLRCDAAAAAAAAIGSFANSGDAAAPGWRIAAERGACWSLVRQRLQELGVALPRPLLQPTHAAALLRSAPTADADAVLRSAWVTASRTRSDRELPAAGRDGHNHHHQQQPQQQPQQHHTLRLHPTVAAAVVTASARAVVAGADAVPRALQVLHAAAHAPHRSLQALAAARSTLVRSLAAQGSCTAAANALQLPHQWIAQLGGAAASARSKRKLRRMREAAVPDGKALAAVFAAMAQTGERSFQNRCHNAVYGHAMHVGWLCDLCICIRVVMQGI